MFIIRRTEERDEYIWEDSDPSEASEPPEDVIPNYWPIPEPPTSSHAPIQAEPPPRETRPDPPA